jgi:heme-degrading monooxygenase HmoA
MGRDQGFMTFTHRGSNTTTSVSYWASTAHWQGPNSRIEHFEVAASRRLAAPGDGAMALLSRLKLRPSRISRAIAFYRKEVFSALQSHGGLCSTELLLDRATGSGISLTVWDNDDSAIAAWSLFNRLGSRATETLGIEFFGLQIFDRVRGTITDGTGLL